MVEEGQIQRVQTSKRPLLNGISFEGCQLPAQEAGQGGGFRGLASFSPNFSDFRTKLQARGVQQQHPDMHHGHGHGVVRAQAQAELMEVLPHGLKFVWRGLKERLEQFSMDA